MPFCLGVMRAKLKNVHRQYTLVCYHFVNLRLQVYLQRMSDGFAIDFITEQQADYRGFMERFVEWCGRNDLHFSSLSWTSVQLQSLKPESLCFIFLCQYSNDQVSRLVLILSIHFLTPPCTVWTFSPGRFKSGRRIQPRTVFSFKIFDQVWFDSCKAGVQSDVPIESNSQHLCMLAAATPITSDGNPLSLVSLWPKTLFVLHCSWTLRWINY